MLSLNSLITGDLWFCPCTPLGDFYARRPPTLDHPPANSPAPCGLCNVPLVWFLISAPYILFARLYRMLPNLLFFHFFLTYLLPYLSFHLRIDPLRVQAGCCKRRLYVASVFCVYFFVKWVGRKTTTQSINQANKGHHRPCLLLLTCCCVKDLMSLSIDVKRCRKKFHTLKTWKRGKKFFLKRLKRDKNIHRVSVYECNFSDTVSSSVLYVF